MQKENHWKIKQSKNQNMSKEKKHNLRSEEFVRRAIKCLTKKNDCRIESNRIIILGKNKPKKNDLGNGSWKYIDGLVNHFNFTKIIN